MVSAPGAELLLNDILRQILAEIAVFPDCAVKLGIGGETQVPANFPGNFGFNYAYSLLLMRFDDVLSDEKPSASIELVPLTAENLDEYVLATNDGFAGTLNVATIQVDDARRLLENRVMRCGLIRSNNSTVGSYELKLEGSDGWIESVCLIPASRGQGYGCAAVVRLIEMLRQLGCETVKLSVIDANKKAYRLYERMGFTVYQVLSRWYSKN